MLLQSCANNNIQQPSNITILPSLGEWYNDTTYTNAVTINFKNNVSDATSKVTEPWIHPTHNNVFRGHLNTVLSQINKDLQRFSSPNMLLIAIQIKHSNSKQMLEQLNTKYKGTPIYNAMFRSTEKDVPVTKTVLANSTITDLETLLFLRGYDIQEYMELSDNYPYANNLTVSLVEVSPEEINENDMVTILYEICGKKQ